jgi:hypothetical protein
MVDIVDISFSAKNQDLGKKKLGILKSRATRVAFWEPAREGQPVGLGRVARLIGSTSYTSGDELGPSRSAFSIRNSIG